MTKEEILEAITELVRVNAPGYVWRSEISPEKLAAFLEKILNEPA